MVSGSITMTGMNKNLGRWGNQIIQYAFLKTCEKRWGLQAHVPRWMGKEWFVGHRDPMPNEKLRDVRERSVGLYPVPPTFDYIKNCDYHGYGQFYSTWYAPYREMIQSFYHLKPKYAERYSEPLRKLHGRGKTIIGMHIRTGDNGWKIYYLPPIEWWRNWLDANWSKYDNPVLLVVAEDYSVVDQLAKWSPATPTSLGIEYSREPYQYFCYLDEDLKRRDPCQMDFFPDWWLLTKCDVVVGSNSTFSWSAAWVSQTTKQYWRTQLATESIEREEPWSSYPCQYYSEEQFPDVPGAWAKQNDYWKYALPDGKRC